MTIIATAPFYHAGSLVAAGPTQLNYSADREASLVREGKASYVGNNPQTGGLVPAMMNSDNAVVDPVTRLPIVRPILSYTWATRPAAADNTGVTIRINDVGGTAGSLWISDGTYWKPVAGSVVLSSGALGWNTTVDGVDTTLVTVGIPAGIMNVSGKLRVWTSWALTGTGNKNLKVKFGATDFFTLAQTTNLSGRWVTEIQNRDATNSQVGGTGSGNSSFGAIAGAILTGAIDTTADVSLIIHGDAAATNTCQLASYVVELIAP